jgi:hypothetical protein
VRGASFVGGPALGGTIPNQLRPSAHGIHVHTAGRLSAEFTGTLPDSKTAAEILLNRIVRSDCGRTGPNDLVVMRRQL